MGFLAPVLAPVAALISGIGTIAQAVCNTCNAISNALPRDDRGTTNAFQPASLLTQGQREFFEQVTEERREDRDRVAQQQQAQQQRQLEWNQDVALLEQSGTPTIYQT